MPLAGNHYIEAGKVARGFIIIYYERSIDVGSYKISFGFNVPFYLFHFLSHGGMLKGWQICREYLHREYYMQAHS